MKSIKRLSILLCLLPIVAHAIMVKHVRVEGAKRLSPASIKEQFSIKAGGDITHHDLSHAVKKLYETGLFKQIDVLQDKQGLLLKIVERPVIVSVDISGNKEVKTNLLKHALIEQSIQVGRVLDPYALKRMERGIVQQYQQNGFHEVQAEIKQDDLGNGKVALHVVITEGKMMKVSHVRFSGNQEFSAFRLRQRMQLTPHLWSFMSRNNVFSEARFAEDRQNILWFYQDHGYLDARFTSYKVVRHKHRATLDMVLEEGKRYRLHSVSASGQLKSLPVDEMLKRLIVGEYYQRNEIVRVRNQIKALYANYGYADITVDPVPKRVGKQHKVDVHFHIHPGKKLLVRRIEFTGNTMTNDRVLRQELRQLEQTVYSQSHIDESERRLNNLGYLKNVHCRRHPVQGHRDQVDMTCQVEEDSSLVGTASFGYSSQEGMLYRLTFDQKNFLGTGQFFHMNLERSDFAKKADVQYTNPYLLASGLSQSMHAFYERTTPNHVNITAYKSDSYGGILGYSLPISDYDRVSVNMGYVHTHLIDHENASTIVQNFVSLYGDRFHEYQLSLGWQHQTLDRFIFPTRGTKQNLNIMAGMPFGDGLRYYRGAYDFEGYLPMTPTGWILQGKMALGYGRAYGHISHQLPFFKNFFAGGIGSIRGFQANALGPMDEHNHALGGNILMTSSVGLIMPQFISDNVRSLLFFDAGSVYDRHIELGQLRMSVGLAVQWRTPLAPIVVALGFPVKSEANDRKEVFAFTLAAGV